ncbi:MAG: DNA-binding protein [Proteobacteria bacterium]|nr:DNA-binding protein [Pseudomonadota bacterium]MBU1688459.1 DNA-binding protein [Pseudomonadota bacterium]
MKHYFLIALGVLVVFSAGCKNSATTSNTESPQTVSQVPQVVQPESGISGSVTETMNASGYTYILVDTGGEKVWVAGPMTQLKVGDEVFVPDGSHMTNFKSNTLNREFEEIIFAASIMVGGADQSFDQAASQAPADHPAGVGGVTPAADITDFSSIVKPEGGKTVENVFNEKGSLNEKEVLLRGKVVKYMSGIMGKNWLHVKDGTGSAGTNDLVVTTQDSAKVGDTVLLKGTLYTDKDFGSGYRYDVIVEEASITVE